MFQTKVVDTNEIQYTFPLNLTVPKITDKIGHYVYIANFYIPQPLWSLDCIENFDYPCFSIICVSAALH